MLVFMNNMKAAKDKFRKPVLFTVFFVTSISLLICANGSDSTNCVSNIVIDLNALNNGGTSCTNILSVLLDKSGSLQKELFILLNKTSTDTPVPSEKKDANWIKTNVQVSGYYDPASLAPGSAPIIEGKYILTHSEKMWNIKTVTLNAKGEYITNCLPPHDNERHLSGSFKIEPK